MKRFSAVVGAALLMIPDMASGQSAQPPGTDSFSVYRYMNTSAFAAGAKRFYSDAVQADAARQKIIRQAEQDCGGRYEGTSVSAVELSHGLELRKPSNGGPIAYGAEARTSWLIVETISCSASGSHYRSVLHAAAIDGVETQTLTYSGNGASGPPTVTDLKRTYETRAEALKELWRAPYD
jgi:hypothetical protein